MKQKMRRISPLTLYFFWLFWLSLRSRTNGLNHNGFSPSCCTAYVWRLFASFKLGKSKLFYLIKKQTTKAHITNLLNSHTEILSNKSILSDIKCVRIKHKAKQCDWMTRAGKCQDIINLPHIRYTILNKS